MDNLNAVGNKKGTGPLEPLELINDWEQQPTPPPAKVSAMEPLFEKLGALLAARGNPSNASQQADPFQSMTLRDFESLGNTPLSHQIRELIAKADMLAATLDLAPIPDSVDVSSLMSDILAILQQLDKDMTDLYKKIEENKDKAVYKLRPSANTKDGFDKSITIETR